jgi:hypothetical protein
MFNNTGGIKCPITNITYAYNSEAIEINNSLRFSIGINDIEIQTIEA